jgi:hypothetical protein
LSEGVERAAQELAAGTYQTAPMTSARHRQHLDFGAVGVAMGVHVGITSSSDEKLARVRNLGANSIVS